MEGLHGARALHGSDDDTAGYRLTIGGKGWSSPLPRRHHKRSM